MPKFFDRGIAALIANQDGTTTVAVCDAVENGQPVHVYAKYVAVSDVRVDAAVTLNKAGSTRYTDRVVDVRGVDGAVTVSLLKHSMTL